MFVDIGSDEIFIVFKKSAIHVFIVFCYLHKVLHKIKYHLSLSYMVVKFLDNSVYVITTQ